MKKLFKFLSLALVSMSLLLPFASAVPPTTASDDDIPNFDEIVYIHLTKCAEREEEREKGNAKERPEEREEHRKVCRKEVKGYCLEYASKIYEKFAKPKEENPEVIDLITTGENASDFANRILMLFENRPEEGEKDFLKILTYEAGHYIMFYLTNLYISKGTDPHAKTKYIFEDWRNFLKKNGHDVSDLKDISNFDRLIDKCCKLVVVMETLYMDKNKEGLQYAIRFMMLNNTIYNPCGFANEPYFHIWAKD